MIQNDKKSQFTVKLLRPMPPSDESSWAFFVLPKDASKKLPRRGRTSVEGTINGHDFQATLEPDGQLSHWLMLSKAQCQASGVNIGDNITLEIAPVVQEPEPQVPSDLQEALSAELAAQAVWHETSTIARVDWIHWITSAKRQNTRVERIKNACEMLASGKKRVCCFDQSGFYSKSLSAPKVAQ